MMPISQYPSTIKIFPGYDETLGKPDSMEESNAAEKQKCLKCHRFAIKFIKSPYRFISPEFEHTFICNPCYLKERRELIANGFLTPKPRGARIKVEHCMNIKCQKPIEHPHKNPDISDIASPFLCKPCCEAVRYRLVKKGVIHPKPGRENPQKQESLSNRQISIINLVSQFQRQTVKYESPPLPPLESINGFNFYPQTTSRFVI